MDQSGEPNISTGKLLLKLLGYVASVAVPTAILAVLIPAYAGYIVLCGIILLLAMSSFMLGWEWDDPGWTPETRMFAKGLLIIFLVIPLNDFLSGFISGDKMDWFFLPIMWAGFALMIFPAFYAGRALHRWRVG